MINSFKERGYEIWIYYPYVLTDEIFKRVEKRAEKTLRYIPEILLDKYIKEAKLNFIKLYDKCNKVWLVDNNKDNDDLTIIYQSLIEYNTDTGQIHKFKCNIDNSSLDEEFKKHISNICDKYL